jgi:alkanesulfonate monooxygenase SsuD/methylene tetrahydromethanopterin reductase-like flavin-dependent oxidoreductase (luciferase family)
MTLELGVYSFGNTRRTASGGYGPTAQAVRDALEAVHVAEEVGLDFFGFGEHHTRSMPLSSPTALVNAAAASTHDIKLGTTVTVLSTDEPVRKFEQLATAAAIAPGASTWCRSRALRHHLPAVRPRRARLRHALRHRGGYHLRSRLDHRPHHQPKRQARQGHDPLWLPRPRQHRLCHDPAPTSPPSSSANSPTTPTCTPRPPSATEAAAQCAASVVAGPVAFADSDSARAHRPAPQNNAASRAGALAPNAGSRAPICAATSRSSR